MMAYGPAHTQVKSATLMPAKADLLFINGNLRWLSNDPGLPELDQVWLGIAQIPAQDLFVMLAEQGSGTLYTPGCFGEVVGRGWVLKCSGHRVVNLSQKASSPDLRRVQQCFEGIHGSGWRAFALYFMEELV